MVHTLSYNYCLLFNSWQRVKKVELVVCKGNEFLFVKMLPVITQTATITTIGQFAAASWTKISFCWFHPDKKAHITVGFYFYYHFTPNIVRKFINSEPF
mgnify:CR=1 FL=1